MKQVLSSAVDSIKTAAKWAYVTAVKPDTGDYPWTQATHNENATDVYALFPYGTYANLPPDALVAVFNIGDQEENKVGVGNVPLKRFKNLKSGELVHGHPLTKVRFFYDKDGNLDLHVPDGNLTVRVDKGDVTMTVGSGDVNLNVPSGQVKIDCPRVEMTGDLFVEGDITDRWKTNPQSLFDLRQIYNIHVHPENDSGGPTDQPNQKMDSS